MYKILVTTTMTHENTCSIHTTVIEFNTETEARYAIIEVNKVTDRHKPFFQIAIPLF
jgi:hypothetical protein